LRYFIYLQSTIGKSLLRQWFLQPSQNVDVVQSRLDTVSFFSLSDNDQLIMEIQGCLRQFKRIFPALRRMQVASATVKDWTSVMQACSNKY
jgi:DNA mismatch repair ATPase MutS